MTRSSQAPDVGPPAQPADGYRLSPTLRALESPPTSPTAIAVHDFAAEIIAQQVRAGRRGLVICGPSRGSGVSFIAANLAIALAQAKLSVLLVDANLHEPGINDLIEPPTPAAGLLEVLRDGDIALNDVAHRDVIPGLSILYGGVAPDASELLAGERCVNLVRECLRDFDFMIVDTPPANRSADARRLASIVGYALIVARRDRTYVDDVATLASELMEDGAVVVGSLLNDA